MFDNKFDLYKSEVCPKIEEHILEHINAPLSGGRPRNVGPRIKRGCFKHPPNYVKFFECTIYKWMDNNMFLNWTENRQQCVVQIPTGSDYNLNYDRDICVQAETS